MERGKILREAATIIRSRVKDLATVEVTDNGRSRHDSCYVNTILGNQVLARKLFDVTS